MNDQTPTLENALEKLIKIMKMTTSSTDGEALAAIRMANSQLTRLKTDWEAVLRGKISIMPDPFGGVPIVNAKPAPPSPAPRPAPQPTPQPRWNPPPPPPPPPRPRPAPPRFPHMDMKEINGLIALAKLKKWGAKTSRRLNDIEHSVVRQGGLDHTDYDFLKQCATGGQTPGSINDL
jgi:hypothetical protein